MAVAIDTAVTAAQSADIEAFTTAAATVREVDREQLVVLLGALTRDVLERTYPDGLDAEGAEDALRSCIRFAVPWYPSIDIDPLIRALTGALDVAGDPDDSEGAPVIDQVTVLTHGLLLIADQLTRLGLTVAPLLETALAELRRALTVEMP
jgi:hypothetical protein